MPYIGFKNHILTHPYQSVYIYCDMPGSPCLSKTGPVVGPYFVNLIAAWSQGGLLETPPRWHATIYCFI